MRKSKKESSLGRAFYTCGKSREEQCDFFQWAKDGGPCRNPLTEGNDTAGVQGGPGGPMQAGPSGSYGGLFDPIDIDDDRADQLAAAPTSGGSSGGSSGGGRGRGRGRSGGGQGASVPRGGAARAGTGRGGVGRGGARRGGGGKRGKRKCPDGSRCRFLHEHQHTSEFSHEEDEKPPAVSFSGAGIKLGGSGGRGDRGGGSSSSTLGGGSVLGGGGGGGGGGGAQDRCEICGGLVPRGLAMELHLAKHERSGEVAAWERRQATQRVLDAQKVEYDASLLADQEREAREAEEAAAEAAAQHEAEREAREAAAARAREEEERKQAETRAEEARAQRQRQREGLAAEPGPCDTATTLKVCAWG